MIETWHDGYGWCVTLAGDYLGRFPSRDQAFAFAYRQKCRLAGIRN